MLEIEGVLVRMRGVGMVVAERRNTAKDKTNLAMPAMLNAAKVVHQLGMERTQAVKLFEQALKTIEMESRKNAD